MLNSTLGRLGILLSHSLRQESRSVAAHRIRIGSLFIAFWLLIIAHLYSWLFGSVGREFVRVLTYLDLLMILVGGSSYFGSAITEEKEQGTLGLLKIAGFSDIGLLFGKSTTRIASALVIFLIQLPFAFLAIILGGTTAKQIIASYLTLAAFLILFANVGLLFSVIARRSTTASAGTFIVGVLLLWSGSLASISLKAGISLKVPFIRKCLQQIVTCQEWSSAHTRLNQVIVSRSSPWTTGQFWGSLVVAMVLFGLSWILFSRSSEYADGADSREIAPSPRRGRSWMFGISRPWKDSLAWKEFHFVSGGYPMILGKSLIYVVLFLLVFQYEKLFRSLYFTNLMEVFHGCLLMLLMIELLSFARSFLGNEFSQGTLPNLWLTPHSLGRLVFSKLKGMLPALTPTLIALMTSAIYLRGDDSIFMEWPPRRYFLSAAFIVLLHLTTYYSLKLRRGAVAWAVVTLILALLVLTPLLEAVRISLNRKANMSNLFTNTSGPEFWAPLVYLCVISCLGLQLAIIHQARNAVGESSG